jgi:hypothetical protein
VEIDPNAVTEGGLVRAALRKVSGPIAVGAQVVVFEPDEDFSALAEVVRFNESRTLFYLRVDWSTEKMGIAAEFDVSMVLSSGGDIATRPADITWLKGDDMLGVREPDEPRYVTGWFGPQPIFSGMRIT